MIAYIFNKADRIIFNKVDNVISNDTSSVFSSEVSFSLKENEDFIMSNQIYKYGEVIPATETNKSISDLTLKSLAEIIENIMLSILQEGL